LLEIESGKVLAKIDVGATAEISLSPRGDLVAVLGGYSVGGVSQPRPRLELYRTANLSLARRGYLPIGRAVYKKAPNTARMLFPVDDEVIVQRNDGHDAVLSRVRVEPDQEGVFQLVGHPIRLPGAEAANFLRIDWPRVTVFGLEGAVHVLDFDQGKQISKVDVEPRAMSIWGRMISDDGKFGYYIPQSSGSRPAGQLQRMDLTADPPKSIRSSEQFESGLRARVSAVSETSGALLIAEQKWVGGGHFPSPCIKFFHALTLSHARDVNVSLSDCDSISTSTDGKYAYVVDYQRGGLSVVEISSGQEVKVLNDVGKHPAFVVALP
jgi:hypothetical protein